MFLLAFFTIVRRVSSFPRLKEEKTLSLIEYGQNKQMAHRMLFSAVVSLAITVVFRHAEFKSGFLFCAISACIPGVVREQNWNQNV